MILFFLDFEVLDDRIDLLEITHQRKIKFVYSIFVEVSVAQIFGSFEDKLGLAHSTLAIDIDCIYFLVLFVKALTPIVEHSEEALASTLLK